MKNSINGGASGSGTGLDVVNPATLEVIDTIEDCGRDAVDLAVSAARDALRPWATSDETRRTAMRACHTVLTEHEDELAELLSREQGKPVAQAYQELRGSARILDWYIDVSLPDEILRENENELVVARRRPIGVLGLVVPWNFPVTILSMKLWAAIRTGNTVIVKPAPTAPLTVLRLAELVNTVLPRGVVNTVTGGADVGQMLTSHPGIDSISFTGSTATGAAVMASAAPTLKRLTLELGGNDPAILLDDVDLTTAVPMLVRSAFHNAGQVCQAIKRVFVPTALVEDVVSQMVDHARATMVIGRGQDADVTLGPVNNGAQQKIVQDLVADAVDQGGKVHELGTARFDALPGYFVRPVVVSGLSLTDRLVAEEQFGPALPVVAYDDLDALVAHLNAEDFGLDASVWSANEARAVEVATWIHAGQVYVNTHAGPPDPEIPFGGVKKSGFGRELGLRGVDDVTDLQVLKVARAVRPS